MAPGDRILVVEDEGIVALELHERLRALGFDVVGPTSTGESAIELARAERPDLVLMDVRLKGRIDGPEAALRIREQFGIPAVFLTAHADDDTLARIKPVEPLAYVIKPFEERSLGVTIEMALHRHRATLERERAERERRSTEARLAMVLDHTHDGVVSVDGSGCICVFNKGAERIFGYRADEVMGANLELLLPESARRIHRGLVDAFVQGPDAARPMGGRREVTGRRKSGDTFPAEITISRLEHDTVILLTACIRDLSDRRELERQLNHAQKMEAVGRLAASVAHDFNNLLAAVQNNAFLAMGPETNPFIEEIFTAVDRGVALTRQLLGFSRPMALDVRVLDANEVVSSLTSLFTRLLREDVALQVDIAAEPAWIRADQHLLEQVLMNLIVNARDALPHGGRVGVRVLARAPEEGPADGDGDSVSRHVIEVWDDGEGVPAALRDKIFEPFFTTKPPGIGTGLGLSTVRSIVRHAGGEISVYPRESGGTIFSVSLPVAEAGAASPRQKRKGGLLPEGSETILVVEDDAAILQATSTILTRQGYRVLQARSCADARSQVDAHGDGVDLVVADVLLPDGPGPTLINSLGDEPRGVLFLTGSTSTPIVASVERLGATVLSKPVDPERLIVEVRRELDRSSRRQGA